MKIKPTPKQLKFMDWEIGVFFHFGIRTFNEGHVDWDEKHMDISTFNPDDVDCDQWVKTAKAGGAKYTILTTKHHDGFCLWPSEYTDYSVKNAPFKRDIVKEYVEACRKNDMHVGLYYSPAQFGSVEMQGKEYDDYFINQISELLTNYGKIEYLWFDGCGSEDHEYDTDRIISVIRSLQPDIMIFAMWDPDTRWVGNEEGFAPYDLTYVVSDARTSIRKNESDSLNSEAFLPYECDCKIRPLNWFWSENDADTLRSLENLMGLYDMSVGNGGNLLLNIAPDRTGRIPEADAARFKEFGEAVKEKYSAPLDVKIEKDGNIYTITSDKWIQFSRIMLKENIENGESIKSFKVSYTLWSDSLIYEGKSVGHKRIIRIPDIVFGNERKLKIEITSSDGDYKLDDILLFK